MNLPTCSKWTLVNYFLRLILRFISLCVCIQTDSRPFAKCLSTEISTLSRPFFSVTFSNLKPVLITFSRPLQVSSTGWLCKVALPIHRGPSRRIHWSSHINWWRKSTVLSTVIRPPPAIRPATPFSRTQTAKSCSACDRRASTRYWPHSGRSRRLCISRRSDLRSTVCWSPTATSTRTSTISTTFSISNRLPPPLPMAILITAHRPTRRMPYQTTLPAHRPVPFTTIWCSTT